MDSDLDVDNVWWHLEHLFPEIDRDTLAAVLFISTLPLGTEVTIAWPEDAGDDDGRLDILRKAWGIVERYGGLGEEE